MARAEDFEQFRRYYSGVPWPIREALLGNVVVQNFSMRTAELIARSIQNRIRRESEKAGEFYSI